MEPAAATPIDAAATTPIDATIGAEMRTALAAIGHLNDGVNKDLIALVREMILREYRIDDIRLDFRYERGHILVYYVAGGTELCMRNEDNSNSDSIPYTCDNVHERIKSIIPYLQAIAAAALCDDMTEMYRKNIGNEHNPYFEFCKGPSADIFRSYVSIGIDFGECILTLTFIFHDEKMPLWRHGNTIYIETRAYIGHGK
jgi:hypothetical protein